MDRGLYIAASGMLAEQVRQSQIANDLANTATPGYKADRTSQTSFGSMMLANTVTGATVGTQSTAVMADATHTDFTPQPARETGDPLDFAIAGDGFFAVRTPQGATSYTRDGQFTVGPDGTLQTATGGQVLSRAGGTIAVGANGTVDPRQLQAVQLTNPRKAGDGLVSGTPGAAVNPAVVRSGALEGSGADPARTMVDLISSMRAFEAGQKTIQTIDESLGKAAGQVGQVHA